MSVSRHCCPIVFPRESKKMNACVGDKLIKRGFQEAHADMSRIETPSAFPVSCLCFRYQKVFGMLWSADWLQKGCTYLKTDMLQSEQHFRRPSFVWTRVKKLKKYIHVQNYENQNTLLHVTAHSSRFKKVAKGQVSKMCILLFCFQYGAPNLDCYWKVS